MSGMNPWLASIYGTNGEEDLEKTAQTHLLQKLAEENNLDLSQFSPEELQQLLNEVMGDQSPAALAGQQGMPQQVQQTQQLQQTQAPQAFAPAANPGQASMQQPQTPAGMMPFQMAPQTGGADMAAMQKEAQAKFEEADLLGRVMAHAYTQELEKIAQSKTAGRFGEAAKHVGHKAHEVAGHVGKAVHHGAKAVASHVKSHKGAYGAGAAGLAAGEAHGRMSKKASAFEKLAEMHAADILGAAGYDPNTGMDTLAAQGEQAATQSPASQQQQVQTEQQQAPGVVQPGQPQASEPGAEFAQALDSRALEMLSNAGYDVNEILARLQLAQGQQSQA